MIDTTYQDGVAVVAMRHGKVNALDTALCQALCSARWTMPPPAARRQWC